MIKIFAKMEYSGAWDAPALVACIRNGMTGKRYDLRFTFKEHNTETGFYSALGPAYEFDGIPCGQTEPFLQAIMDAMWASGMRPKGHTTEGEIASVRYHLEDMRKLVFSKTYEVPSDIQNLFVGDKK